MSEIYDLVIAGSGPAGLAAAIYAQRACLNAVVLERAPMSGGQVLNTYEVDNYPGLPGMNGFDLSMKFREHAEALHAVFKRDEIQEIRQVSIEEAELVQAAETAADMWNGPLYQVAGKKETYLARTVLFATGATHRKLEVPGEEKLTGAGVSYCATCDGAFYRNRDVAVVGGGDVALEDAIYLARNCHHVYLIHRREELRGAKNLQEKLFSLKNVSILWNTVVEKICGQDAVEALQIKNKVTGKQEELKLDGVFVAVGIVPNSQLAEGLVDLEHGYICADEMGRTGTPGIFAAGDVRTKELRQIITAAADGANAVTSVDHYLSGR